MIDGWGVKVKKISKMRLPWYGEYTTIAANIHNPDQPVVTLNINVQDKSGKNFA